MLTGGCQRNSTVTGKVLFEDGSPLTKGMVIFTGDAGVARGPIDADGSYRLGFEKNANGVPKGNYKVYIFDAAYKIEGASKMAPMVPLIEEKFMKPETSGLICNVDKGSMVYDITVTKLPPEIEKARINAAKSAPAVVTRPPIR